MLFGPKRRMFLVFYWFLLGSSLLSYWIALQQREGGNNTPRGGGEEEEEDASFLPSFPSFFLPASLTHERKKERRLSRVPFVKTCLAGLPIFLLSVPVACLPVCLPLKPDRQTGRQEKTSFLFTHSHSAIFLMCLILIFLYLSRFMNSAITFVTGTSAAWKARCRLTSS